MDGSDDSGKSYLKRVFEFEDGTKSELLNTIQYTLLAIIPIVIFNKLMAKFVPEANPTKGSLEIVAEIVIQSLVIFIGLFFINRIIVNIPTYSGKKYVDINIINIILSILLVTMSLQTKLGEKVAILVERITEMWNGGSNNKKPAGKGANGGGVRVSQPISGQQQMAPPPPAINQQSYTNGTAISALPTNEVNYGNENTIQVQQLPNYNNMYQKDPTPLVGAATPGVNEGFDGIMPANAVLGGSFGGSAW
jgi:hypothetical protein